MSKVTVNRDGAIGLVSIDNPPVNASSQAVRAGLVDAVTQLEADPDVRAVVLMCAGRTFVAGADISEFGKPPLSPSLPETVSAIEAARKPWIAALHGTALGGGLELALGCHYRIAHETARMGLPEVTLGLIPGAGGTVRLPRLIDPKNAVTMIAGGKPIDAKTAHDWGLVDRVENDDLTRAAIDYAREVADVPLPEAALSRPPKGTLSADAWQTLANDTKQKARGQTSPNAAVEAVRRATELAAKPALKAERDTFISLRDSVEAKALRHVFFAEKSVVKSPVAASPRPLDHVGVVGGGTMGAGIAAAVLMSGSAVTMIERDAAALERGLTTVRSHLGNALSRGLLTQTRHDALLETLSGSITYSALGKADLVIEAVFEDMGVKHEVFKALDAATRPNCVLATNTSYLDINAIATVVADPSRVIGLHFFSPAHVMKLLEIVRPEKIADDVLATGFALGKQLRKISVLAGVCDGFIGNRIMSAYRRVCDYMLEDGASPTQIDTAMTDFGFPMGIFAMQDLAGLDIAWAMRKRQAATRDPAQRYVKIADRLCALERFGRKTSKGWYDYSTDKKGAPDPVVAEIIRDEATKNGIVQRVFSDDEIMVTILETMQQEGAKILEEGIAADPESIDVVMINGYGFPRWRGGPMFMRRT